MREAKVFETSGATLPALILMLSSIGCATSHAAAPKATAAAPAPQLAARHEAMPVAPDGMAPHEQPKLVPREELPRAAREALSARMDRHSEELTFLLASVVLLDYPEVETLAEMIAIEPKLGRPLPDEKDTLNALLPPAFFVHQDLLTKRAQNLAKAAQERSDIDLAKAFGALTETCVGCHAAYLGADFEDDDGGQHGL